MLRRLFRLLQNFKCKNCKMDLVATQQPHFIPGYTGHCPQFRFRSGKTFGKLTHKLLVDPCVNHAPELIVTPVSKIQTLLEYPTKEEIDIVRHREKFVDPVYRHPLIPGYDGFVPNVASKIGKRFIAAATAGLAEHERLLERLRCERRHLLHKDLLGSGLGRFDPKLGERLMPTTTYRSPLVPVQTRAQGTHLLDCSTYKEKKLPYSKFTVPHFMEDDDEEKYIINGYSGHIPMAMARFGQSNKQLTNSALSEFTNNYHHRRSAEWCPMESAGVGSSCPNSGQFVIYHRNIGLVPNYGGHVPGEAFTFGRTYGMATVDAKNWLEIHKD